MIDLKTLSGAARLAGVIGWPVEHSRSPRLHGFWLAKYNVDGAYVPLAVAPDHLHQVLQTLPMLGFRGVNLTVPHKESALTAISDLDDQARRIGAVNTLIIDGNHILGRNTDAYGFAQNLHERAPHWQAGQGPAVVLGAGGAARAVVVALQDLGVAEIRILNRSEARAHALAHSMNMAGKPPVRVLDWNDPAPAFAGAGLLVNSTSLGMGHAPLPDLPLQDLPDHAVVADIVYTPLDTALLEAARARRLHTVDGLGMLIHQARPGFAAWFGVDPQPDEALRQYLLADLSA